MSSVRKFSSGRHRRWLVLPALWMLALSVAAQGTIVHTQLSTPNPDPNFPWDFEGLRLLSAFDPVYHQMDMNGDGTAEFTFMSANASSGGFAILAGPDNAVMSFRSLDTAFAVPLAADSVIGPDPSPYEWTRHGSPSDGLPFGSVLTACVDIGCVGLFTGVESGYAGLQFQIDGQTHYGWVRVGAPLAGLNGGWIYEYAYDTQPGVPILAGAVPEPSTWALMVAGGVFMVWLKGKRNEKRG